MVRQRGFSMIELMIAMVLGLIMAAAISAVFVASKTGVRSTDQVGELQESASFAMRLISEDLRQANMLGPLGAPLVVGTNTDLNGVVVGNDCFGGGVNNASLPRNTAPAGSFTMLWGGIAGTNPMVCSGTPTFSPVTGTDILQVKRLAGPPATAATWRNDRLYALVNSTQVRFWPGTTVPVFPAGIPDGQYFPYLHHVYYIANETRGTRTIPVLRRRYLTVDATGVHMADETLVEGIERFHVMYGIDTDGDALANFYASADTMPDADWIGSTGQRVVSARLYILARAREADPSFSGNFSYTLGDQAAYTPADHFRRLLVQTTINLPNPQYQQVNN